MEGVADRMSIADCPFIVKVRIHDLNIRKGAGTNTAKAGAYTGVGVFTIWYRLNRPGAGFESIVAL